MIKDGWVRARTQAGGCPACGGVKTDRDPPHDADKCWLAPAERVDLDGGRSIERPLGWKVLCAGQYTVGGGPAADSRYVLDPDMQPKGDFNRQYILRKILEKIQAGQAGGRGGQRRRVARRGGGFGGGAAGGHGFADKLAAGTSVARPHAGEQADRAAFAASLWERATDDGRGSQLIDAYLRARGRDPGVLRPMLSLRYLAECPFGEDDGTGGRRALTLPAILMPVTNADGDVIAVHRIAIEPDGSGKSSAVGNAKQLIGSPLPGAWIEIAGDDRGGGYAMACEGPETGWAIAEAVGCRVLVCVSTSGLWNLELPADQVGEGDGQTGTVVLAADADAESWRLRTDKGTVRVERGDPAWRSADAYQVGMSGQRIARMAARKLRAEYPGLNVGVAFPRSKGLVKFDEHAQTRPTEQAGEWVPVDPGAKSVDFEDVANGDGSDKGKQAGLKRVAKLIDQAVRAAVAIKRERAIDDGIDDGGLIPPLNITRAAAGRPGDDDPRVLPTQQRRVIEWFVHECYPSENPGRESGAAYRLVWLRGRWWQYDGRIWVEMDDEEIRGTLRRWLETMFVEKTVGKGEGATTDLFNVVPNTRMLNEMLDTAKTELHVPAAELPGYVQSTYDTDGKPMGYGDGHRQRMLSRTEADAEGMPDLERSIMFADGTMPIESLLAGEPAVRPHDERLLSMSGIPYAWPEEATKAIRRGDIEGWLQDSCPNFIEYLNWVDASNPGARDVIVRHHGASIGMLRDDETAVWVHGEPGCGKGTLFKLLMKHHGDAAMTGIRLSQLVEKDFLIGLEGKRAAVVGEMESGGMDQLQTAEILKIAISGEPLRARELFNKYVDFQPSARWWLVSNRLFKIRDPGDALSKRIVFVEFPEGVRGTDRQSADFGRRILSEARAALVYCVWHGLRPFVMLRQQDRHPIKPPKRHNESMEVFGMQSNTLSRFVNDHIEYASEPVDRYGNAGDAASGPVEVPWISVKAIHDAFCRYNNEKVTEAAIKPAQVSSEFKAVRSRARQQGDKRSGKWRGAVYHGVRFREGSLDELFGGEDASGIGGFGTAAKPAGPMWPEA